MHSSNNSVLSSPHCHPTRCMQSANTKWSESWKSLRSQVPGITIPLLSPIVYQRCHISTSINLPVSQGRGRGTTHYPLQSIEPHTAEEVIINTVPSDKSLLLAYISIRTWTTAALVNHVSVWRTLSACTRALSLPQIQSAECIPHRTLYKSTARATSTPSTQLQLYKTQTYKDQTLQAHIIHLSKCTIKRSNTCSRT